MKLLLWLFFVLLFQQQPLPHRWKITTPFPKATLTPAPITQRQGAPTIYVVAKRATGDGLDLSAEKKAKEELAKLKIPLAPAAARADLVFILLTEYDTYGGVVGNASGGYGSIVGSSRTYLKGASALAVPLTVWTEYKDNWEKLKEHTVWQGDAPKGFYGANLSKLVKAFHQEYFKQRQ